MSSSEIIGYVPILTTVFAWFFFREILAHYRSRKTFYLLWWTLGVLTFGLGTLSESIHALFGWNELNLRFWYIVGALLGGFPLAQGSVYLLMPKRFGHVSSIIVVSLILLGSVFVMLSPISIPENFDNRLTGAVFGWQWVRYFSPLINLYAFIFLVGGAIYSAVQYYGKTNKRPHFIGNIWIAIGALLPGIGGSFTRFGYVEVLFITELLGLVSIYLGYRMIKRANTRIREVSIP